MRGGGFSILGRRFGVLGLERSRALLRDSVRRLARGSLEARAVRRVADAGQVAIANLELPRPVLVSIGSPLAVRSTVLARRRTSLDAFAVAVSATILLMFVAVLLAAGMLAVEREEHVFARRIRRLVSRLTLLGEKVAPGAGCALAVALAMLCGIGVFMDLDWARLPLWVMALAGGAVAFGALGVAIGAVARDVRAVSVLAFLLVLPVALLARVPSGSVAAPPYDATRGVSALFRVRPALEALDAALNRSRPNVVPALAHLAVLVPAYLAVACAAIGRVA